MSSEISAAAPKKADLKKWARLEAKRLALKRQADELAKQQDDLEESFLPYAREHNGSELHGFKLFVKMRAGTVQWKHQFVQIAGKDQAEALIAAAPRKERLEIEAVG